MDSTKRLFATAPLFACILALCLALCACAGSDNASSSSSSSASSAATASTAAGQSSSTADEGADADADANDADDAQESESSATTPDEPVFSGTWQMVAMRDGEEVYRVEDVDASMRDQLDISLQLNPDGSLSFNNAGQALSGTWQSTSDATLAIQFDPTEEFEEIPLYTGTLEDGVLAIEEAGLVMMFERAA